MTKRKRGSGLRETTAGLLMMAAGVVLLLDQQRIIEIGSIGHWWPAAPVVLGLWQMTAPPEERDVAGGAASVIIGAWLLACTHGWMGFTFRNSWPMALVAFGVTMVIKAVTPARPTTGAAGGKENSHA